MAKKIKAIKCPHCGSIKKTQIKDDHYLCDNCETEYYLDNDDVNVNVNHNHSTTSTYNPPLVGIKNVKIFLLIVFAVFFVAIFIPLLFFSPNNSSTSSSTGKNSSGVLQKGENLGDAFAFTKEGTTDPIMVLFIEKITYSNDGNTKQVFARFYDPIKEEVINNMEVKEAGGSFANYENRTFSDGNTYVVPKEGKGIYKLDETSLKLIDVTDKMFSNRVEFASGIAALKFVYFVHGDGLEVLTNDGKKLFYYPIPNLLYEDQKEYYKACSSLEALQPNPIISSYFAFTAESRDYKKEKTQLIKINYKENLGYPKRMENFPKWWKNPWKGNAKEMTVGVRAIGWEDITPGRNYFSADVILDNGKNLIIRGNKTAAPKSPQFIQCFDPETFKIRWTYDVGNAKNSSSIPNSYPVKAYDNGKGFVLKTGVDTFVIIDSVGKEQKKINFNRRY